MEVKTEKNNPINKIKIKRTKVTISNKINEIIEKSIGLCHNDADNGGGNDEKISKYIRTISARKNDIA